MKAQIMQAANDTANLDRVGNRVGQDHVRGVEGAPFWRGEGPKGCPQAREG